MGTQLALCFQPTTAVPSAIDQWRYVAAGQAIGYAGAPALNSYDDYLALVAAVQADVERVSKRVVRVPVATMIAELEKHGWPGSVSGNSLVSEPLLRPPR